MTVRSVSMVKVALGISSVILFCLLASPTSAQPKSEDFSKKKITLSCENVRFEAVLKQLTQQTNLHFIYSSSLVAMNHPVTVMVDHLSVNKVLDIIAQQMDITFKKQGNYFVIKRNPVSHSTAGKNELSAILPKQVAAPDDISGLENNPENYDSPNQRFRVHYVEPDLNFRDDASTKDLLRFGPGLANWDTAIVLRYLPLLLEHKSLCPYQKRWFASAGLFFNEFGGGLETQVGIRALYAITNVSLLRDGLYRFGYGLGTSIPIKPGVSANLAYTFASIRRKETDDWENLYKATSQHHQVRLTMNVTLSKHFSIRVGPSVNLLNTHHYFQEQLPIVMVVRHRSMSAPNSMGPAQSGFLQTVTYPTTAPSTEYKTSKSWVGFEAGVAYRINFSLAK